MAKHGLLGCDEPVHVHIVAGEVESDEELECESPLRESCSKIAEKTCCGTAENRRQLRRALRGRAVLAGP